MTDQEFVASALWGLIAPPLYILLGSLIVLIIGKMVLPRGPEDDDGDDGDDDDGDETLNRVRNGRRVINM
jgi:hypothetical protein